MKVAGTLNPPELHLKGDFNLDNYMTVDREDGEDVANTELIYFQAIIGDKSFDISVMRVGGDEEAEIYKKFFKDNFGDDISEDAVFHASQYKGKPSMDGEDFQTLEEVKDRVREIFQQARKQEVTR